MPIHSLYSGFKHNRFTSYCSLLKLHHLLTISSSNQHTKIEQRASAQYVVSYCVLPLQELYMESLMLGQ